MTTDDDARARALEENRRRSKVMEEAQRHGPPARGHGLVTDWSQQNVTEGHDDGEVGE